MEKLRPHILFSLLILMVAGLFFSRALLAISIGVFTAFSLLHPRYKEHIMAFLKQPLCWGSSLIFFIPLVSGLWSADKMQWLQMMQVKLPLLLMPLAFAWPLGFEDRQWRWLVLFLIAMVFGGCLYSLQAYYFNEVYFNRSYLEGRSLLTPLENDHVRFSWMVFAMIIWGSLYYLKYRSCRFRPVLAILLVFFIVYLHVLAARTGLLALYLSAIMLAIYFIYRMDGKRAVLVFLGLILLPLIAWFTFPSFKNKLLLFKYESDYSIHRSYLPGSNDVVRMISIRAGWNLFLQEPITGTGYGDMLAKSQEWYKTRYPEMKADDQIYPSSQYLLMGAGTGVFGLLAFILILLVPLSANMYWSLPWRMILSGLAASYLFDIGLEVQYGVFIHCFFLFLSWQWMKRQNMASL